jgi:hypothetical protein
MATEVYINIKDLPELPQINNGDYILVETSTGTHTLNFQNLLLPTQNTVITETVNQNASAFTSYAADLSSNINVLYTNTDIISSNLEALSSSTQTDIELINSNFTSNINSLSGIANAKIENSQVTIKQGDNSASTIIVVQSEIDSSNLLITPVNKYAALYPAYVDIINPTTGLVTIKGAFNTQIATFNSALSTVSLSTNYINAEEDAIYNVFFIKN